MSEELKPCPNPWCAGHQQLPAKGKAGWRVICACGVRTFAHDEMSDAVAQWNTRPAPKADGLVEELCRLLIEPSNSTRADWDMVTEAYVAGLEQIRDAALKDRDVVLEEAAGRAAFVAGYRAAHMVPDAYDSTSAAEEAWEGYRLVSRNLKERV